MAQLEAPGGTPPSNPPRPLGGDATEMASEVATAILSALAPSRIFALILEKTRKALDAESASLLLVHEGRNELYSLTRGESAAQRFEPPPGKGICHWVAERGTPALVVNASADPRFSPAHDAPFGRTVRSAVAAPVLDAGRVSGVLCAANPARAERFDERDLERLASMVPWTVFAIRHAFAASELGPQALERLDDARIEQRISERTAQISLAKREWERTFDAILEPIFLLDGFVIRRANLAFASLVGTDIRSILGKACHEAVAGCARPCTGCPVGVTPPKSGELTLRGRIFRVSSFPLETGTWVVHYRDITEERRLEIQLRQNQKMASVGRLAAGAAHEINNPLGFLISDLDTLEAYFADVLTALRRIESLRSLARAGQAERALELLQRDDLMPAETVREVEETPEVLEECRQGAHRVREIVKALKELTSESNACRTLERPAVLLERALRRASPKARVVVEGDAECKVPVEPAAIEIALANVLRNADQSSPEGASIVVRFEREAESLLVRVRDEGCGMSADVQARVFEPFFTTRGIGEGLGLGLTAAYGIVGRHGGSIDLDSAPGRGTTVSLRLPFGPPDNQAASPQDRTA